jgi:hypothetical protein
MSEQAPHEPTFRRRRNSLLHSYVLVSRRLMARPSRMLAMLGAYAGIAILAAPDLDKYPLQYYLERYGIKVFGVALLAVSVTFVLKDFLRRAEERSTSFLDVDDSSRRKALQDDVVRDLSSELKDLKSQLPTVNYDRIAEMLQSARSSSRTAAIPGTFPGYFHDVRTLLEEKAENADKKASLLLDRGVSYSRLGIVFYLLSIVVWQALAWVHGFQTHFTYGIASCSLLFIFIEFLSAWFLKQYRHFVDTSTYLMKVKSIFDRYMLTFLASSDQSLGGAARGDLLAGVLSVLKDDIKWPDTYLLKNGDVSFAREIMESLAEVTRSISAARKGKESE